jgi:uncharacterized protein (TIGR02246 family)
MTTSPTVQSPISPPDQAAVAAVPARMIAAWAAHDADGFADLFLADGSMLLPGLYKKGRDEIRAYMADAFATHYQGTRVVGKPVEMKPLGADAVALVTVGGVVRAGASELADADAIRASWIMVRDGDTWRLAVYQNGPRDVA